MTIHNQNNILVLSCLGGNGHEAARKAIEQEFGARYRFTVYYPFKDFQISRIVDSETFYNGMVQKGFNRAINYLAVAAPYLLTTCPGKRIVKQIETLIDDLQPACVISLAPIINRFAIEVCAKHKIPYCLITLDADLTNWVIGLKNIKPLLKNTVITIGADIPQTRGMLERQQLHPKEIQTIGFPIRKEFSQTRGKREDLCHSLGLDPDRAVIMLMWGGAGSDRMYQIMKKLGPQHFGVQFVVITGTNHNLAESIQTLPMHPSNSIRVLGFTHQVADYMEVSNILITKPGPGTISEATAVHQRTGRPYVFLDGNASCFFWEKPNIEIVKRNKIGEAFANEEELIAKVAHRLLHSTRSSHLDRICKNEFSARIVSIVDELVRTSTQARIKEAYHQQFLKLFPDALQAAFSNLDFSDLSQIAIEGTYSDPHSEKRAVTFDRAFHGFKGINNQIIGLAFRVNALGKQKLIYLYKIPNSRHWNVFMRTPECLTQAVFYTPKMISWMSYFLNYPEFQTTFFKNLLNGKNPQLQLSSPPEIWTCNMKKRSSQPELSEDIKEPFSQRTSTSLFSTDESEIALEEPANPPAQQIRSYWQTLPAQAISQVVNILSWPWRKSTGHTA